MFSASLFPLATERVKAETLEDALAAAYAYNPSLAGERARSRATDEDVARAHSGYRPRVDISAFRGQRALSGEPGYGDRNGTAPHGFELTVRQPVFRGFRTLNGIRAAEALASAGHDGLRAQEARVLVNVVAAYMSVVRDRNVVEARRKLVNALNEEVRSVKARLGSQDATVADLAQAQSRRARAVAELEFSQAEVASSEALYEEIIGHRPKQLSVPGVRVAHLIPGSREDAIAMADRNPNVQAAQMRERAAAHNVEVIRGELLPEVSLDANRTRAWETDPLTRSVNDYQLVARVRMPLYEGGETYARLRKAKEEQIAASYDVRTVLGQVQTSIASSHARYVAAKSQLMANEKRVTAAEQALEGVLAEQRMGGRTVLDVLNARQEAVEARVALVAAKADHLVGAYQVVASAGLLTAAELGVAERVYVPEAHLEETRFKPIGTRVSEEPVRATLFGGWKTVTTTTSEPIGRDAGSDRTTSVWHTETRTGR